MTNESPMNDHVLRVPDVVKKTGLSRGTIWRMEKQGKFPSRVKLTDYAIGYRNSEVETWLTNRPKVA